MYPSARVADIVRHYCELYGRGVDCRRAGRARRPRPTGDGRRGGGSAAASSSGCRSRSRSPPARGRVPRRADVRRRRQRPRHDPQRSSATSPTAAAPSCWRRTSSTRPSGSPTGSSSSTAGEVVADGTLDELRRGHDEIRFRSAPDLDIAALAAGARAPVRQRSATASTSIDAPPHPQLIGAADDLAGRAAAIRSTDLRAGAQRLEDVVPPAHRATDRRRARR